MSTYMPLHTYTGIAQSATHVELLEITNRESLEQLLRLQAQNTDDTSLKKRIEDARLELQRQQDAYKLKLQLQKKEELRKENENKYYAMSRGVNPLVASSPLLALAYMSKLNLTDDLKNQLNAGNKIYTPEVNNFSFNNYKIANTPSYDEQLSKSFQSSNDPRNAYMREQYNNLLDRIYSRYEANEQTRHHTDNHMHTAQDIFENIFTQQRQAQQDAQAHYNDQANQAAQTQLLLAQHIAKSATEAGMNKDTAKQYGQEMAVAFVIGQRINEQNYARTTNCQEACRFLEQEHKNGQDLILHGQRDPNERTHGTGHSPDKPNIGDDTAQKLAEQRRLKENKKDFENKFDPKEIKTNYAEINVVDEYGKPTDHHTDKAVLGAATNQAGQQIDAKLAVVENDKGLNAYGSVPRGASTPGQTPIVTSPGIVKGVERHELERDFQHPFGPVNNN